MTLPFPVQEDSYGKTLTIILTPIELKNGNTVTLWTEEKSVEGTETQYAGEVINKTIVYRERVSDRLSTVSIFILIILIVSLLYELTQRIQNKKIFSTCLNGKNVRIGIYAFFVILLIVKMGFYSSYVAGFPDEGAHLSYIAYLEESDKLVPEFEKMQLLENIGNSVKEESKFAEGSVNYLGHSPLYYQILKVSQNICIRGNGTVQINLFFLRLFSQFMGLIATGIYFFLGFKYIKLSWMTILYAATVTLIPMFAYNLAGISNDTLSLLGVSILLLGLTRIEDGNDNIGTYWLIAIGFFLSSMSKLTCGMIVVISGVLYIVYLVKKNRAEKVFCKKLLFTMPLYFLVAGYYIYIL